MVCKSAGRKKAVCDFREVFVAPDNQGECVEVELFVRTAKEERKKGCFLRAFGTQN